MVISPGVIDNADWRFLNPFNGTDWGQYKLLTVSGPDLVDMYKHVDDVKII